MSPPCNWRHRRASEALVPRATQRKFEANPTWVDERAPSFADTTDCFAKRRDHRCLFTKPVDEELLGLFLGMSRVDGPPSGPADAPRILLFLDNLWAFAEADRESFAEEVETTFLHELGHYLGLDEDDVADRGLA